MDNPFRKQDDTSGSFLPESYVANKTQARANALGLTLFIVVMVGIVGAFMVTNRQWNAVKAEQESINALYEEEAQKIEQLKALEEQRVELVSKAEITTALVDRVPRSVLLAEIVTAMPDPVTLLEFELESKRVKVKAPSKSSSKSGSSVRTISSRDRKSSSKKKEEPPKPQPPRFETSLSLIGVATANNDIADFLANLKDCPLLEDVEIEYIRESRMQDLDLRKFRVNAKVRRDADAQDVENAEPTTLVDWQPVASATSSGEDAQ